MYCASCCHESIVSVPSDPLTLYHHLYLTLDIGHGIEYELYFVVCHTASNVSCGKVSK